MHTERDFGAWNEIVYVHNGPVPSLAANAVQVVKTCEALQRAGMRIKLVTPKYRSGTSDEIRVRYHLEAALETHTVPAPRIPGGQLIYGYLTSAQHGTKGTSIYYTRSIAVASVLARAQRDVILELHEPMDSFRARNRRRLIDLARSQFLRRLVVISRALASHYTSALVVASDRICVAPDGAEIRMTPNKAVELTGDFKVGYVGQLYAGKGMEIVSAIAPLCPQATFHIVGGTPEDVSRWRALLQSMPNVVFHGYVPFAQTPSYIAAMDVVIAPYLRTVRGIGGGAANLADWMSPLKLFEYMAAGKAIVTSDLPVIKEVLEHKHDCMLCDPDDPDVWVDALNVLQRNTVFRSTLGESAQQKLAKHYTWDARAQSILACLERRVLAEA